MASRIEDYAIIGTQADPRQRESRLRAGDHLDRKDYNITWNRVLDEGGALLGDEVKVTIELEMKKKGQE